LGDSDPSDRDRNDQTGEWAGDTDVEHFATISAQPVHANHGSHRPDRANDGEWNEVGKAGWYSMTQGCEKVPHLMSQKDRQDASGVDQPVLPVDQNCGAKRHQAAGLQWLRDQKLPCVPLRRTREKRRETGQNEEV
jgi:hypothetical protein